MEKAEIKITVVKTSKGNIRIEFDDTSSYLVKNEPYNWALISALEIELEFALKKKNAATN